MVNDSTPAWLGIAALLIGAVVRLLKADRLNLALERFGAKPIPKRVLPWIAVVLGVASGVIAGMQVGKTWSAALVGAFEGLVAGAFAIMGHELVVESARDGKEIAPPKTPPPPGAGLVLAFMLTVTLAACALLRPAVHAILSELDVQCIWRAPMDDARSLRKVCAIKDALDEDIDAVVGQKVAARKAGVYLPWDGGYRVAYDAGALDAGGAP